MKKILLLTLLLILSVNYSPANDAGDKYKKEFRDYIELSGSRASYDRIMDMVFQSGIPGLMYSDDMEKIAAIKEKGIEKLIEIFVPIYQQYISYDDLKAFNKFYRSGAGKRISSKLPDITLSTMESMNHWVAEFVKLVGEESLPMVDTEIIIEE